MYKWKKLMKSGAIVSSDSSTSSIDSAPSYASQPSSPLPAPLTLLPSMPSLTSSNRKISVDSQGNEQNSTSAAPIDSVLTPSTEIDIPTSANATTKKRERDEKDGKTKYKVKKRRKTKPNLQLDVAPPPNFEIVGNTNVSIKRLLAMEDDHNHVNALHCFVRQNIEVFTASIEDINIPAPGRKSRIHLGQVGVRCIHCQKIPSKERVKRAVCYPSSVNRVYHSVSDMKFDHFTACKSIPSHLKEKFLQLKDIHKRRSSQTQLLPSSTAQYYCDSARAIGMVDYRGGIFLKSHEAFTTKLSNNSNAAISNTQEIHKRNLIKKQPKNTVARFLWHNHTSLPVKPKCLSVSGNNDSVFQGYRLHQQDQDMKNAIDDHNQQIHLYSINHNDKNNAVARSTLHNDAFPRPIILKKNMEKNIFFTVREKQQALRRLPRVPYQYINTDNVRPINSNDLVVSRPIHGSERNERYTLPIYPTYNSNTKMGLHNRNSNETLHSSKNSRSNTIRRLGLHDDNLVLNPLHCFVRNNVELFTATEDDISAPSPGRKLKVVIGQVGIRCIHCADLMIKDRVKRSVCYPPTVCGIYHCVSNMKFDHFSACRGMPEDLQQEFLSLKKSCSRKGSGGISGTNYTAYYYQTSALKVGLFDSKNGIRWKNPNKIGLEKNPQLTRNQGHWNLSDPRGNTCRKDYVVPPSNNSSPHFIPIIPSVSTPHSHTQYQIIPAMKNKSKKKLPKHETPSTTNKSNNRNSTFATLCKSKSHNDGLSALMIAAAEHSHREEVKNNISNTSFSSLSSPNFFASINVQR